MTDFKFHGGELNVELLDIQSNYQTRCFHLKSSDDILRMYFICSELEQMNIVYDLVIPYFPYARQDRKESNKIFTLQHFCKLINSLNYRTITISDPHSNVTPALLNRCVVENPHPGNLFNNTDVFVSPDAGAEKRVERWCQVYGKPLIRAYKNRDGRTGEITGTYISNTKDIDPFKSHIVIDDICDGGRTFVELGKLLVSHGVEDLKLFVTHGIFSNGFDELLKYYESIWCTNSRGQSNTTCFEAANKRGEGKLQ